MGQHTGKRARPGQSGGRRRGLFRGLRRRYRCGKAPEARAALRRWYGTPLGSELLASEQAMLEEALHNLFGYHLLQIGVPAEADLLGASRIAHRVLVCDGDEAAGSGTSRFTAAADRWPVATASVDLVLLPHTLELEPDPHQVLRETERCLIPEGHVVILCFNPASLWGLRRLLGGWRRQPPWCAHFFTLTRMRDWLALLGFDTVAVRSYFFRPPFRHTGLMGRLQFLERAGRRWWPMPGAGYIVVARKRVATLTPIRPRWRRTRLVPGRLTQPTVRRNKPTP